ncbi:protein transport protein sec13, putative [Leishmania tarentolae]|uniref:Protein transport protein sec13, putative n=1 Tax=Leishmania tarentolae TaxID=5689 RepID=A0A640KK87_LEITA|nr:protein transport protein sec13, putative [Leishmania tarentolae]
MSDTILDTGHTAAVTDIAADANGRYLATASNDGTVRVYESVASSSKEALQYKGGPQPTTWSPVAVLQCSGEEQAATVTCLAWAPPALYAAALVTCTEVTNEVALWCDVGNDAQYRKIYVYTLTTPGWCVAWAPHEYGKLFAVGCADGAVVVFTGGPDGTWDIHSFESHPHGCSSLSFAPFFPPGALLMAPLEKDVGNVPGNAPPIPLAPPRMVTCGGGRLVKLWTHSFAARPGEEGSGGPLRSVWTSIELEAAEALGAPAWREVSWAPNMGLPFTYIAAGSEDGLVAVWLQDGPASSTWQCRVLPPPHGTPGESVTKLSWSLVGTFLLVSYADGMVAMWKETSNHGAWRVVSELENPTL